MNLEERLSTELHGWNPDVPVELDSLSLARRARRRRTGLALTAAAGVVTVSVAAALAATSGVTHHEAPEGNSRTPATTPTPHATASAAGVTTWRGPGSLAYISRGVLHVPDAQTGTDRTVTTSGRATTPAWSPDRRYLAYLVLGGSDPLDDTPGSVLGPEQGEVWVYDQHGRHATRVSAAGSSLQWSARGILGFLAPDATATHVTLRTWSPTSRGQDVADLGLSGTFSWSPDGSQVATTTLSRNGQGGTTTLVVSGADGSKPIIRYRQRGSGLLLNKWWPDGRGLLFWIDPQFSSSLAADGMDLMSLPNSTPTPRRLGSTLGYATNVATSNLNVAAIVLADGRFAWTRQHLRLCVFTESRCSSPPGLNGLDADPTLSDTDATVFFVHGADEGDAFNADPSHYKAWYATRQLWEWSITGGEPMPIPRAGTAVAAPEVHSHTLLYVRDNALWLLDLASDAQPVQVSGPLFSQAPPPNYYGITDWRDSYAWSG
jgi:hypothetical protein